MSQVIEKELVKYEIWDEMQFVKNRKVLIFVFSDLHADTAGKLFFCNGLGVKYSKD
jgi:hypothetical protein